MADQKAMKTLIGGRLSESGLSPARLKPAIFTLPAVLFAVLAAVRCSGLCIAGLNPLVWAPSRA